MNKRNLRHARALTVVLALTLVAAACGSGGGDDEPEATTTTEAPARSTTTSTTTPDGPVAPLTGVPVEDEADLLSQPAVVVKIGNNDTNAWNALTGLDQADIVFEERIEGNATRFAAVFHTNLPEVVGSVRSGRTSDIDIVSNLNGPVFMYSGSNSGVARQLRDAEDEGILFRLAEDLGNDALFRDRDRGKADASLFASPAEGIEVAEDGPQPAVPVFEYLSSDEEFVGDDAPGVMVDARSPSVWAWDADAEQYVRYQAASGNPESATPFETQDGDPIAADNIVVLFISYTRNSIDPASVDAQTVGQGDALILSQGKVIEGSWLRPFAAGRYALLDEDENEIALSPGKTWVSLSPVGEAELWDADQIADLVGDADEGDE